MTKSTPELTPAWNEQPFLERIKSCRVMLYVHGFLTEAERDRVDKRIDKYEVDNG